MITLTALAASPRRPQMIADTENAMKSGFDLRLAVALVCVAALVACSNPEGDFKKAEQANTEEAFNAFIKKHPDSPLIAQAKSRIEKNAYESARKAASVAAYEGFLKRYKMGEFGDQAKHELENVEFANAKTTAAISSWEAFLQKYSQTTNGKMAREELARLHLQPIIATNTVSAYEAFAKDFPGTEAAKEAMKRIEILDYQAATNANDISGYETFLGKHSEGDLFADIRKRLEPQLEERDWNKALIENTAISYITFRRLHSDSTRLIVVEEDLKCTLRDPAKGATFYPNPGAALKGPRSSFDNLRVILSSLHTKLRDLSLKDAVQLGIIGSIEDGESVTLNIPTAVSDKRFLAIPESSGGDVVVRIVAIAEAEKIEDGLAALDRAMKEVVSRAAYSEVRTAKWWPTSYVALVQYAVQEKGSQEGDTLGKATLEQVESAEIRLAGVGNRFSLTHLLIHPRASAQERERAWKFTIDSSPGLLKELVPEYYGDMIPIAVGSSIMPNNTGKVMMKALGREHFLEGTIWRIRGPLVIEINALSSWTIEGSRGWPISFLLVRDVGPVYLTGVGSITRDGQVVFSTTLDDIHGLKRISDRRKGDASAQYNLGVMYANGQGVTKDDAEAVKWYRKAADLGFAIAQVNLGVAYANGKGVAKDDAEALKWYRKAAELGNANAQSILGFRYDIGRGVAKNEAEAVKWYRKAADQGDADAQSNLGVMFENGRGVAKDQAEAVKWYRKAANLGNTKAQINLGLMYANGRGIVKDEAEAVKWYRKAADQGDADAQINLGWMYANGRGVAKDAAESARWYRRAAEQNLAIAQSHLGDMYAKGQGVIKDPVQAHAWFKVAEGNGNDSTRSTRSEIEKEMTSEQLAEATKLARVLIEQLMLKNRQ